MSTDATFQLLKSTKNTLIISMGSDECYEEFPCFDIYNNPEIKLLFCAIYPTAKYVNVKDVDGNLLINIFDDEQNYLTYVKLDRLLDITSMQ